MARRAWNSESCGVVWKLRKSNPANGSVDGESVMTSEKSIFRIDSGATVTLFSIDPAIPTSRMIQKKKHNTEPAKKASRPARKVLMKFIIRLFLSLTISFTGQR